MEVALKENPICITKTRKINISPIKPKIEIAFCL